jgi:CRISPR-associated protein Cas1
VARIQLRQRQGYQWVVDADIHGFFDNIDHSILMAEVGQLIKDVGLLALIQCWLQAVVVADGQRFELDKGIPQGSPIAPVLSNLYLHHLDETLLDNDLCLVRFADDFVILCKSQDRAEQALELTDTVLGQLRLRFNAHKTRIVHFDQGFRFLGVQFIRSLAFKTEADPPDGLLGLPPLPESAPIAAAQAAEPLTLMQLAFSEAKLAADDFPAREPPLENWALPDPEDLPSDHEPLLRTLYILQHGQVLGKESERLVVRQEKQIVREIPALKVDQIMVFGNAQITTQAMQLCLQERIPIYLLSGQGQYYGVIDSFTTEPVLLQREQFLRAGDATFCLKLATAVVSGKIANSRLMLQRLTRRHNGGELTQATDTLKNLLARLPAATTLDELRGFEGSAAKTYFQALAASVDPAWGFNRRIRQPPTDGINALLSYGYTLLFYNVYSLLRSRGLNPQVGFLHALQQGHPALASDMMEEFRAPVVDAVVWKLVLNNHLTPADFDYPRTEGAGCYLKAPARQTFIKALEEKLNAAINHPVTQQPLDYRRCMEYQVEHLTQVIRGTASSYQPLVFR